jgi:cytochrome b6
VISGLQQWVWDRFGLDPMVHLAEKKEVPVHKHSFWYYWGGMTLFLFGIQVVTGILLLLYYRPSADEAYESVHFIMTQVDFGWLIRGIHSWSANLMIGAAMIHMFSVFFMRGYRGPREGTWFSGFALLALAMGFGFSGYLLPWNELAFFATKVGADITGAVPVVGPVMKRFLLGGDQITGGTLTRFYGIHVAILPAITTVLLGVHLYLVQFHGMSTPPGIEQSGKPVGKMKFVPNFLLRDSVGWLAALGLLAILAALFPWELGEKADPYSVAPEGIRPEWYFGWMFQTLKLLPAHIMGMEGEVLGIVGIGLVGFLWAAVPFLDRTKGLGLQAKLWSVVGVIAIVYIIIFTVWAFQ